MEGQLIPSQPLLLDFKTVMVYTFSLSVFMIEFLRHRDVFGDLQYCLVRESSRGAVTSVRADTSIPVPMI